MRYTLLLVLNLPWLICDSAYSTSFGLREAGVLVSINGKPAICVPEHAKKNFLVGWISLTESYKRNPPSWGASLLPGFKPLTLSPGECITFGAAPEGYEFDSYKLGTKELALKVNRTYVFSLVDANFPTNSYDAVFCVNKTVTGSVEYLQYTRLADGSQISPACDGKRNADTAGAIGSGDVNK